MPAGPAGVAAGPPATVAEDAAPAFLLLFRRHPVPMWIFELETLRMLEVNDYALEHYGYSRSEFLELRVPDLRPPDDVPALLAAIGRFDGQPGRSGPWRHRRADGSLIWADVAVQGITYDDKPAALVTATDVSEQLTWKRALELSQERFSLLVDVIEEYAIVLLDPVGRVVSWNRGAARLYGFDEHDAIGRRVIDFFPDTETARAIFVARLRSDDSAGPLRVETQQLRADGSAFRADVLLAPLSTERTAAAGFVQITRDVSVLRAHEQNLIEAQERAEYIDTITSTHLKELSHQVRTPLTGIIGAAEVLVTDVGKEHRSLVESIHRNGQYLLEVAETAIEYLQLQGQVDALAVTTLDLRDVATAVVLRHEARARSLGLHLESDLHAAPVHARAHADVLDRVLTQLLRNALKFTPTGQVIVRVTGGDDGPTIEVQDTGVGMSPSFLETVFEPFAQEDPTYGRPLPGSGLGLPIAFQQMRRMGGTIEAESEKGRGSRFTLRLPPTLRS